MAPPLVRSPSPPHRIGINSCPLEIVQLCLDLGTRDESDRDRRLFLLSACLVQRAWRHSAQDLLWKVLNVVGGDHAQRVMDSSRMGVYRTTCMRLDCSDTDDLISEGQAEKLLTGLRDLQHLQLYWWDDFQWSLLCLPNLRELHSLVLRSSTIFEGDAPVPTPSFFLRNLALESYMSNSTIPFTRFSSSCRCLSWLEYDFVSPNLDLEDDFNFVQFFPPIAAGLEVLNLMKGEPIPTSFIPLLSSCTNLQDLRVIASATNIARILRSLSSESKITDFGCVPDVEDDEVSEFKTQWAMVLKSDLEKVPSSIFICEMSWSRLTYLEDAEAWLLLVSHLEKHGKRVVFKEQEAG